MRLARALAAAGIASRRRCEEHISNGAVSVNGEVVTHLATQVDPDSDTIAFRGRTLVFQRPVYYLLHKPPGYVTTAYDPHVKKHVYHLLPRELVSATRQPKHHRTRVFPVGRLDRDSSGLLLFTNDGELAHRLMHPRFGVAKGYQVRLSRPFEAKDVLKLKKGIRLREGMARVEKIRQHSPRVLTVVLREGKNREIRRLFAKLEYHVVRLVRRTLGPLSMGSLPEGAVRKLSPAEVRTLQQAVSS